MATKAKKTKKKKAATKGRKLRSKGGRASKAGRKSTLKTPVKKSRASSAAPKAPVKKSRASSASPKAPAKTAEVSSSASAKKSGSFSFIVLLLAVALVSSLPYVLDFMAGSQQQGSDAAGTLSNSLVQRRQRAGLDERPTASVPADSVKRGRSSGGGPELEAAVRDTQASTTKSASNSRQLEMDPLDAVMPRTNFTDFCTQAPSPEVSYAVKQRKYVIDEDTCYNLTGVEVIDCYTQLSVKVRNPNLCLNLANKFDQDQCIRHFSINLTYGCRLFDNSTLEALLCYNELSAYLDDYKYCYNVVDKPPMYLRSTCLHTYVSLNRYQYKDKILPIVDEIPNRDIMHYTKALINKDKTECFGIRAKDPNLQGLREKCIECVGKDPLLCRLYISPNQQKLVIV